MPDFNTKKRQELASKGQAMSGGEYPIRNVADLKRAIQAFGRAKNPAKTKAWIIKRAKALNAVDLLPEDWKKNMAHSETLDEVLAHHGIKGMKWGVRRKNPSGEPPSEDAAKANASRAKAKTSSTDVLSDEELRKLVNRMNLEQQYADLTAKSNNRNATIVDHGKSWIKEALRESAKTEIKNLVKSQISQQVAPKLGEALASHVAGAKVKSPKLKPAGPKQY